MEVTSFTYILAFGSNCGNKEENIQNALIELEKWGLWKKKGQMIKTEPLASSQYDISDHDSYVNSVALFESFLEPDELMRQIIILEDQFGHSRLRRWAPRHLDIDILFCIKEGKNISYTSSLLKIPHGDIWNRAFLLDLIFQEFSYSEDFLKNIL